MQENKYLADFKARTKNCPSSPSARPGGPQPAGAGAQPPKSPLLTYRPPPTSLSFTPIPPQPVSKGGRKRKYMPYWQRLRKGLANRQWYFSKRCVPGGGMEVGMNGFGGGYGGNTGDRGGCSQQNGQNQEYNDGEMEVQETCKDESMKNDIDYGDEDEEEKDNPDSDSGPQTTQVPGYSPKKEEQKGSEYCEEASAELLKAVEGNVKTKSEVKIKTKSDVKTKAESRIKFKLDEQVKSLADLKSEVKTQIKTQIKTQVKTKDEKVKTEVKTEPDQPGAQEEEKEKENSEEESSEEEETDQEDQADRKQDDQQTPATGPAAENEAQIESLIGDDQLKETSNQQLAGQATSKPIVEGELQSREPEPAQEDTSEEESLTGSEDSKESSQDIVAVDQGTPPSGLKPSEEDKQEKASEASSKTTAENIQTSDVNPEPLTSQKVEDLPSNPEPIQSELEAPVPRTEIQGAVPIIPQPSKSQEPPQPSPDPQSHPTQQAQIPDPEAHPLEAAPALPREEPLETQPPGPDPPQKASPPSTTLLPQKRPQLAPASLMKMIKSSQVAVTSCKQGQAKSKPTEIKVKNEQVPTARDGPKSKYVEHLRGLLGGPAAKALPSPSGSPTLPSTSKGPLGGGAPGVIGYQQVKYQGGIKGEGNFKTMNPIKMQAPPPYQMTKMKLEEWREERKCLQRLKAEDDDGSYYEGEYYLNDIKQEPCFIPKRVQFMTSGNKRGRLWYIYILQSINMQYKTATYVGMTNDIEHRLRQHNKDITGGAKYTSSKGPWQFLMYMSGFPDKLSTLKAEWQIKNISRKLPTYRGPVGRVKSVVLILTEFERWTANYRGLIEHERYVITIQQRFSQLLEDIEEMDNITIRHFDDDEIQGYSFDIGENVSERKLQKERDIKITNRL